MKNLILLALLSLSITATATTKQDCSARSPGSLIDRSENYGHLLANSTATSKTVKANKAKSTKGTR